MMRKLKTMMSGRPFSMDRFTIGIRTSAIEEAYEMFAMLLYPGPAVWAVSHTFLELTVPFLWFYFHDGVRDLLLLGLVFPSVTCSFPVLIDFIFRRIPLLWACGETSRMLTSQMASATFLQLTNCIYMEHSSFPTSLYKHFTQSARHWGTRGADVWVSMTGSSRRVWLNSNCRVLRISGKHMMCPPRVIWRMGGIWYRWRRSRILRWRIWESYLYVLIQASIVGCYFECEEFWLLSVGLWWWGVGYSSSGLSCFVFCFILYFHVVQGWMGQVLKAWAHLDIVQDLKDGNTVHLALGMWYVIQLHK